MAEYVEEVFESNGVNDDKCSLVDEGYWYENDLLLAAELGKTLLERNRDLECQLNLQTKNTNNLRMEIDLLKKQLETLRELNRNKMMLYEDVDRNSNDLEVANRSLAMENKKAVDRIYHLSKKNSFLEQQVEEYLERISLHEQQIDELKKAAHFQSSKDGLGSELNVKSSDDLSVNIEKVEYKICTRCKELKEKIFVLAADLEVKCQENDSFQKEVANLKRKIRLAEVELEDIRSVTPSETKQNHARPDTLVEDLYSSLEYDIDRVDERPVEVGSLDSGGKVFSSTKSLRSIGAETSQQNEPSSLLTELDEKYNTLVNQYETLLLQTSSSSSSAPTCPERSCDTVTAMDDGFQKRLDNIFSEETRRQRKLLTTQNYRPKYKELFRDAFTILKDMKQSKRHEDSSEKAGSLAMKTLSEDPSPSSR